MSSIHHHDYQHQFYYSLKLNKYLDFFFLENRRIKNIIFLSSSLSFSIHWKIAFHLATGWKTRNVNFSTFLLFFFDHRVRGLRGEKEKQHDNRQQESVIQSVTSERKKKKGSVDLLSGASHRAMWREARNFERRYANSRLWTFAALPKPSQMISFA